MDLQNIIPEDGPAIEEVQKYIKKYIDEIIVIKCGGSVLLDQNLFNQFIQPVKVSHMDEDQILLKQSDVWAIEDV